MLARLGRRAVLAVYALLVTVPLLVVGGGSLKTTAELFDAPFGSPTSPRLGNYVEVLTTQNLLRVLGNSALVVAVSVPTTLVLASLVAYAIARLPGWPGRAL
ncbi:carbohydrate ABC transporter permease, partial [Micromonospora mangrovi]